MQREHVYLIERQDFRTKERRIVHTGVVGHVQARRLCRELKTQNPDRAIAFYAVKLPHLPTGRPSGR
jgi:hypothetical protein